MILAIILVVILFSLLVILHELGHFVSARRNGVEAEEFGIGFPPKAVGLKVGRTLVSINWLPLGGFVRLKGEDNVQTGPGTFGGATTWVKTKILLAGVGMNALTAYILLLILCFGGLPAAFTSGFNLAKPASVSKKQVMVVDVSKGSSAERADIKKGDVVVSANGQQLSTEDDLKNFTRAHAGQTVEFDLIVGGKHLQKSVQLQTADQAKDGGFLGVTPFSTQEFSYGAKAPLVAASLFGQIVWGTIYGIGQTIAGIFHHKPASEIAVTGPVGIVMIMSSILYLGWRYLLFFLALVSISLALINVLPFPALDGGRLFFVWLAKIRRKPVSPELEAKIHTAGFVFLLMLMALITIVDIKRPH